jgi:RsiW-degrading membrane proteinase PrsW (M82 family)
MGLFTGLLLAFVFPLGLLGIIRKFDFYQVGQFPLIVKSLVCGVLAYVVASSTNKILVVSGIVDSKTMDQFIAPILEELLKGLVLLYWIGLSKITFSVDGALYGFATGIGFAIVENIEYVPYDQTAVIVALQRIFSANLVHASSSAILGIALWIFYLKRTRWRWLFLTTGLSLAIGLHMFYNVTISSGGTSLASAFGIGILGAVFVYLAMQQGKLQARAWIRQKLGMFDGVTPGEVAMVDRLPTMSDLLHPVFERFGCDKARQMEKLLYLQARLGIKRNFVDSIPKNDPSRSTAEKDLRTMRTEMRAAQRAVGAYTMLFVRGLYTGELISVWDQMQAKILAGAKEKGGQKGGGLWSSLEERLQAPGNMDRHE